MNRKLLRGEHLISTWRDITLTSHRIWQDAREGSSAALTSMPVDAVQWVRLGRHHLPWLLWLAAVTAVLGIAALEYDRTITYGLFGVALLLMLLYGTTRRLVLEIGAGTGKLVVQVVGEGASFDAALEFLYQVEGRRQVHVSGADARSGASASGAWPGAGGAGG
ncbi:hypothetical protein [Nannocystis sp. SCPEA4]|uniref:hypothetical protein n=1 Tax=Nannocystis sp. SCPEA4 TaxID=2996787 RepID=UPI0022720716|nr:hypothetical protein [Nannocystis sp. SCPEA4]MCY1057098.1 hypothetical protein [Nannocystis sp. SCPEA4]